jgi:hypothetical protein
MSTFDELHHATTLLEELKYNVLLEVGRGFKDNLVKSDELFYFNVRFTPYHSCGFDDIGSH